MRMNWHELLFMHWPIPASSIRSLIPDNLEIDTFDGSAWIGVVPFRMSGVAPRCSPDIPGLSAFPELNVRTYVTTADKKHGVWFFSLDATSRFAVRVARRFFHLPYMDAKIEMQREGDSFCYRSTRVHRNEPPAELDCDYRPIGPAAKTTEGTFEHWLTARYCLYAHNGKKTLRGEIAHPPWQLQSAECEVRSNTMLQPIVSQAGRSKPVLHYADRTDVVAWTTDAIA